MESATHSPEHIHIFNKYASVLSMRISTPAKDPGWRAICIGVGWSLRQPPVTERRNPRVSEKRWSLREQVMRRGQIFIDIISVIFGVGARV